MTHPLSPVATQTAEAETGGNVHARETTSYHLCHSPSPLSDDSVKGLRIPKDGEVHFEPHSLICLSRPHSIFIYFDH